MSRDRVALVTGAGRGIGRGIVEALAEHSWTVVVNYRSNAQTAMETLHLVKKAVCLLDIPVHSPCAG